MNPSPPVAEADAHARHPSLDSALKRGLDLCLTLGFAPLWLPLLGLVALLVLATLGRPLLFRQQRPGLWGRPFTLVKFRTMRPPALETGEGGVTGDIAESERVTRLGALLRASGLDELPGLWHILRGEMSLVGPRPLLLEYLPLYTAEQARRHRVRPGFTGLAQLRGRDDLSWPELLALDLRYVDTWSVWLDLKILLLTPLAFFRRRGSIRDRFRGGGAPDA